ncbi:Low-complexity acidic protein [Minicystis rosea]|nr:Low-complexity acidic protein [Minicystis rosea]
MSTTETREMCQEVEESLSEILDGTASARLFDHVAECDACRDLKHEAQNAAERVRHAGADFRPADDFVEQLLGRLDAARPATSGPKASPRAALESGDASTRTSEPRASMRTASGVAASATAVPIDGAATAFDPLAAAKAEEAEAESRRAETGATIHDTQPSARDPRAPAGRTREEAPAPIAVQPASAREAASSGSAPSGVAAKTLHGPVTAPPSAEESDPPAERAAPVKASRTIEEAPAQASRAIEAAPVVPKAPPARSKVSPLRRPAILAGGAFAAVAAAAAIGFGLKGGVLPTTASAVGPWSGAVASISRASADKNGGLDACDASNRCAPVNGGANVAPGSTLKTDARTRARVTLADGTELSIDRASEIELASGKSRTARVKRGTVVADVAHVQGSAARFAIPRGEVEVLGTKLAITASDDRASIEVARGNVRVHTDSGKTVDVRAGEEATLVGNAEPQVSSSSSLADTMEWSDQKPEEVDAPVLRGLGELRARKPGQTQEKDHAVRLAKHAVKVRVVDVVARTEVDETFTNDTDEELEGIYRFPLPPGAQIEKLALEVDGKMIDGAFVDRDKGAAIWRGVIQNAAPKAPKPREEIIWVPGPWRDPALLEWQRGGRFELKIFPIPKRGSRRVVLTYTQAVEQTAGLRRFTYPLAHDANGSTRIGSFDLDLQVLGLDKSVGLSTRGYELERAGDERRTLHASDFVPAGDLTVEYALPDRDKEVTAWAYQAPRTETLTLATNSTTDTREGKNKPADQKVAKQAAAAILEDESPYVALALRPRLPRWQEAKERLHVIVVDASRSMFGERFGRATHLASSIVREMDRRDSFMLLACDTTCRPLAEGGSTSPRAAAPGPTAAADVERFLGSIEPDGGSDLAASMAAARTAAGALSGKELRILYLGDGTPSVGPTRPAHLEAAVRSSVFQGGSGGSDAAVVAVALGADADTTSLAALARGGGGVMVPYVPGQKVSSAALDVLGAAYGVVLRDAEVELPAGLSQVTPARLDPIRAGGETILVARMSSGREVEGALKLRGKVAGERFEQSYPIKIAASTSAGNAFVPRLYAAAKIAEIERTGGESQKATAIELSKRFAVASRFTSLLVLESEAMFKAFGLDRHALAQTFTGEQLADSSSGESATPKDDDASPDATLVPRAANAVPAGKVAANGYGDLEERAEGAGASRRGATGGGPRPAPAKPMAPPPISGFDSPAQAEPAQKGWLGDPLSPAEEKPAAKAPARKKADIGLDDESWQRSRGRRFIPMRKVFERHVGFSTTPAFSNNAAKLAAAEGAVASAPNSRDKTVELFSMYSTLGRLGEAQELTAKWAGRDALDPDALLARADLAVRQGDRDRAVRILGGLADVRPGDRAVQTRLADLHDAAGHAALACEHRIALADLAPSELRLVVSAMNCARTQGLVDLANALRFDAADKVREALDKLAAQQVPSSITPRGDMSISAEWAGGADLDIGLIDAQGKRTSWLGSATKATVSGRDVTSTRNEALEITGLPQGNYVVEITRVGTGSDPIRGDVTVRFGSEVTRLPFSLVGQRAEVGTVRVFFTSRLVPL